MSIHLQNRQNCGADLTDIDVDVEGRDTMASSQELDSYYKKSRRLTFSGVGSHLWSRYIRKVIDES